MNPETLYPEIKTMTSADIFIERAWIVRGKEIIKLKPLKIITKRERDAFVRSLKDMFNAEEVNLAYISK